MPRLQTPMHMLPWVAKDIPDVDDLYLVHIEDSDGNTDHEGLFPVPWTARHCVPLVDAWSIDEYGDAEENLAEWQERWGWDEDPEHNRTRLDMNTPTVRHPISMTFEWGEGHPKGVDGDVTVEMLPHEESGWGNYCKHCWKEYTGKPEDCPVRRLRAMADAVLQARAGIHVRAVRMWHQEKPDGE